MRLSWEEVDGRCRRALGALGYGETAAAVISGHLVAAEAGGLPALGIARLAWIAEVLDAGAPRGDPSTLDDGQPAVVVDGHGGIGYPAVERALSAALARLPKAGVVVIGVRQVFLTGVLRSYASSLAVRGVASILTSSAAPAVVASGRGGRSVLGTNPLCIGVPAGPRPLLFDTGCTTVSYSELRARQSAGRPLADGAGIDAEGLPTTDPAAVLDGGALLPWAGHRGFGLAAAVQALGMLVGAPPTPSALDDCGLFGVLVDPTVFGFADATTKGVATLAAALSEAAPPVSVTRLPGERWCTRQEYARRAGLDLNPAAMRLLADIDARGPISSDSGTAPRNFGGDRTR